MQGPSEFIFLPGLLRTTRECAQGGHLPLFERVPVAYVNRASLLSEALLVFCVNQGMSASSLLYSLNCKFFPYLSLYLYISLPLPSMLRIPWNQPGLDPGKGTFPSFIRKGILVFPLQLKRRRSQREAREELQGSCHNSKRTRSKNPLQISLIPLH